MALQIPEDPNYYAVESDRIVPPGVLYFSVRAYEDGARGEHNMRVHKALAARNYVIRVDPDQPTRSQAYAYLKTLPEFEGAIDV